MPRPVRRGRHHLARGKMVPQIEHIKNAFDAVGNGNSIVNQGRRKLLSEWLEVLDIYTFTTQ